MILNLNNIQRKTIVVSSNTTAENDNIYTVVANATFTDPSPIEGKGYRVFVRNGTATINAVAYTEGTSILRLFHSGAWVSYVSLPDSNFVASNTPITGATKTKVTYDSKGLVTSGTDATTADIADSTNKRYVTDTQRDAIAVSGTIIVTSGTSFTTPSNITTSTKFDIILVGGGGGGAGQQASNVTAGGGGGGSVCEILSLTGLTPSTTYTCAIGLAGAGGAANTNGNNGGTTTLLINSVTYTAAGGLGGLTGSGSPLGGNGGTATNGTRNLAGEKGEYGISGAAAFGGKGGDSALGQGFGGYPTANGSN
jgi:hypothetical protein